jgi:hypothetical protein
MVARTNFSGNPQTAGHERVHDHVNVHVHVKVHDRRYIPLEVHLRDWVAGTGLIARPHRFRNVLQQSVARPNF